MDLIDFHTHFFPPKLAQALWRWFDQVHWPVHYQKYEDDLVDILKKQEVSYCVSLIYPHRPEMTTSLNQWSYALKKRYAGFIIPFGSIHPDNDQKEKLLKECFEELQLKGIKLHSHVQKVAPDDSRLDPVYDYCNAQQKIILFHCGTGPHFKEHLPKGYGYDVTKICGVKRFEKAIKRYPKIHFVVPHLGFEEIEDFVHLLDDYPNLYLDTSMALAGFFDHPLKAEWLQKHPDRFLFGTDFPNIPHEWVTEKNILLKMDLGKAIERKIFYENAGDLLGIDQ